jgi:hypothetical protein
MSHGAEDGLMNEDETMSKRFTATLRKSGRKGGWTYVVWRR